MGANSGIGISLGDNCTVEAGLYVTAGTKITLLNENGKIVKALELNKKVICCIFEIQFLEKYMQKK